MKRLTQNRIEILRCLTEGDPDCGLAPYSVSSVHYMIYGFELHEDKVLRKSRENQIRRTLNELVCDGLVIMSRSKNEGSNTRLPFWENEYQIAAMADANHYERELREIERKISHAYNGFGGIFFGKPDGEGLTEMDKNALILKVKSIIQKSHPDKPNGDAVRFKRMKKLLEMLRNMPVN